jgi:uncharacterized integral membrane protein
MRPRLRRSDEELPEQPGPEEGAPAEEGLRQWQPRLYLKLIILLAVIAFAIAFVLENRKRVHMHFVFGTTEVSLIWVVLLSIALGLIGGVLLSQLNRRGRRRQ